MNALRKLWAGWLWVWANHIQKTLGSLLAGTALFDLMSALGLYETTLTQLLGLRLYSTLRGVCAVGIMIRAVVKPRAP